jgi:hypothetical protein
MKLNARIALLAAISVSYAVQASAVPTIQNGSFEDVQIASPFRSINPADIPGWTHSGPFGDALLWAIGYVDGGGNISVAGQGNQFVTLGNGFNNFGGGTSHWTSQISGLTPGNSYLLSFMVANEGGDANMPETMIVAFDDGSSTGPQNFTAPTQAANYWKTWLPESLIFTATAATATVDFSTVNQPFDMGLDNVQVAGAPAVIGTPEPASLLLLGAGLAALGVSRRRQGM